MTDHWRLTATAMAAGLRHGSMTSEALVASCLARIAEREAAVQAWEWLDPEAALAEARARDAAPAKGPLHGVPVGIKDIIDTCDMPTACGSPIYAGRRPERDADCVARLRAAGAVILGKTVTTEFATFRPGKTRNPRDPDHTPGGSSSGSAAAVGAGMVPLALGSQTVGSVIRPASYCGVVGFKASQGRLSLEGVKPLAVDLDSLGCFARTVADVALWFAALAGEPPPAADAAPRRIALVRTAQWQEARLETRQAVEAAAEVLAQAGAEVVEPSLPAEFERLAALQDVIFCAGAAAALAPERAAHRSLLSPQLQAILERGAAVSADELAQAAGVAQRCRERFDQLFGEVDLVLAPAAPGEAPAGLESTGDPLFSRMWTLLLGPCLSLPAARGPKNLPVGVQLIGRRGADRTFLGDALWAEAALGLA
ncbi:MAG: amidase [Tistlia sp.]|uniref:amidase n=1 Tax=Tistlia sp. TaxID=3057121 RepID=UPI0034A1A4B0